MADNVLVEKVFNFICGSGGFVELSVLLKHSSPLGSRKSEQEARDWLKIQGDRPFVMIGDGEIDGVRIRLKKKICQQYLEKGSCRRAQGNCKFWHICKDFIEGNCAGKCDRSHSFFDEENREKAKQLGLDKYPIGTVKNIVSWSLPQVCQLYLRGECDSDKCFYLHVCSQAVQGSACGCSLSHNLTDSHNNRILKQFDLVPHQSMSTKFVCCNILVPKDQNVFGNGAKRSSTCGQASTGIMSNLVDSLTPNTTLSDGTKGQRETIADCSKQSESERNSPIKSRSKSQEHSKLEDVQSKATKREPTEPTPDVINNLANNSTSPASVNSVKLMNIQVGEDETCSNSSSDENKSAHMGIKTLKCMEDDHPISVKRDLSESSKMPEQSSGTTDETKGKEMGKQLERGQICKKPQKKNSASGKKIQSAKKTTPVADSATTRLGLEVQASALPKEDTTHDFVKKWVMGSDYDMKDSPRSKDLVSQLTTKDEAVGRKQRLSVSSSCSSVPDPQKGAPSKKAIFDCILKEYDGSVSFDAISKRKDLFTVGCEDIARWFQARKDSFLLREEASKILEVSVFCRRSRLCFNQMCSKKDCQYWHVCRGFISGFCRFGTRCQRNHSFQYDVDRKFISKIKLDGLTDDELRKVLQLSTPQVCLDYNDGCCTRALSCYQVHICKDFIKKQCSDEEDCGLHHESTFKEPHTAAALQKYGLKYTDSSSVLRMLLVCDSTPKSLKGSRYNTSSKNIADTCTSTNSGLLDSSKGTAAVTSVEPSEMKVFECLCREYSCSVSFTKISKRTDLFPGKFNKVEAWFRKKTGSFLITEDDQGMILQVDAYSTKARLCLSYNSSSRGECTRKNCSYLHVCRDYITDSCVSGVTCLRNHHFQDKRDKALLSKIKLDTLTDEQLRKLVLSSVPQACLEYNNGMCNQGGSCNRVHICNDHLKKCCSEGNGCDLDHESAMHTEHTQAVLKHYQMEHLSDDVVKRIILVCGDLTNGKETVHIHQDSPDEPICSDFLLGKCKKGFKCRGHHCSLPFHWQYNKGGEWKSFNEHDNEKVERLYCNVVLEECKATNVQISFESDGFLFLDEHYDVNILLDNKLAFIQKDFETIASLRRLSTHSYVTDPDNPVATQWIWYWKDEYGIWKEYEQDQMGRNLQQPLEKAFLNSESSFRFRIADQEYEASLSPTSAMSQTNVKYGTTRYIRRRPAKFVSRNDIGELKRSHNLLLVKEKQGKRTKSANLPSHWSLMPSKTQYKRVLLTSVSDEFKEVEKLFKKSMRRSVEIIGIERVQNPFMWEKYQRKKENMSASKHAVNEKQLFHGTNPEIVEAICKQNFDWRLHGKNATKYGEGSYFALNSSYSDAYATEDASSSKFMFVAKVVVGSYTVGQSSYRRPPEKDPGNPASDLYDSCVDDRWSPTIFVVFDTDQFYPEYIIEYSAVSRGYQQPATRAPVPRFRRVQVAASQSQSSRTHTSSKPTSHYASGSSSGLGTSALSSGSTAAAAGYSYASSVPSYSTSTSSGPYSYSSGATNASYHSTGSASAYTGGSNLYSSSSSSTYTSRSSSSNPPTRSTSPTGTSAYSSPSSYTGMSSPYSSSASSSYSSKPRNSYPSTTETRQKSSKEPKCLVM